ncbi:polysaccharide lyase 6 family protein [Brevifollis gellanilyticus]|uniref:Lyase n=1 Tax=Brevifollis gellanilyticus TaxID=748831 RepID=A0A512MDT7_9BACT|nr:polysaccharide lyase 6 family protein [Brevifollis gellanilyticus]GEP44903.1 hypothetical protein BGE01nite_41940 [Brevifollis gellanilyticus]
MNLFSKHWIACGLITAALGFTTALAEEKSELAKLLSNLQPGSTVEVPDGTHTLKSPITLRDLHGTEEKPVVIRAVHRGKAVIGGVGGFILKECDHVVIEGFVFENDADAQCVRVENCHYVQVTRNVFRPKERAKPRHWEHWVTVEGAKSSHNRVDHNLFEKKVNRGSPVFVRGDDVALVNSQHDRVDHNHFRDVIYANKENGHETIRTGGNDLGASGQSSFTIIEDNLLERCSGEDELMSLKSSDNIVRRNTLINCRGAICMRLGNRNVAENNIIIATEDGPGFGGIKLYGFEHRVTGNYFAGLTGAKHEAPFSFFPGMHDTLTTENIRDKYDDNTASAATRCTVTGNTWVDCAPLYMGLEKEDKQRQYLPKECVFTNNTVVHTKPLGKPLVIQGLVHSLTAKDNIAYADAKPEAEWASWFRWEAAKPAIAAPKQLTAADVGPDAP